jgi:hypothetical protein
MKVVYNDGGFLATRFVWTKGLIKLGLTFEDMAKSEF